MKAKPRKTRETRAAYRVRTKRTIGKPRARRARARKVAATVPWEERIAPTDGQLMEWHLWLNEHSDELEEKYPGQYLAIWDKQVIASADTRRQVYSLADRMMPQVIPLVTYIPNVDEIAFVPSVFPVEWSQVADAERDK
jgi:hypothetical protein